MAGPLADVINCAKFYLNQIRGFDSVGVKLLASPQEREVAVNTAYDVALSDKPTSGLLINLNTAAMTLVYVLRLSHFTSPFLLTCKLE